TKNLGGNHCYQRHTNSQIQIGCGGSNPGDNLVRNISEEQKTQHRLTACMCCLNSLRINLSNGIYTWDDIYHIGNDYEDEESSDQREKPFPINLPGHTFN